MEITLWKKYYASASLGILDSEKFYIGALDRPIEGTFIWYFTGEQLAFYDWNSVNTQDGLRPDEDCLAYRHRWGWYDENCKNTYRAICEKWNHAGPENVVYWTWEDKPPK